MAESKIERVKARKNISLRGGSSRTEGEKFDYDTGKDPDRLVKMGLIDVPSAAAPAAADPKKA